MATAAQACGSDLTHACVARQLDGIHEWTGGGLHAAADPGTNEPPTCGLLMGMHRTEFVRVSPEEPGTYQCDPSYVYDVTGEVVDRHDIGPDRIAPLTRPTVGSIRPVSARTFATGRSGRMVMSYEQDDLREAAMGYDRLTVVDASFLHIETAHEPQHVGALLYLDAGPLRDEQGRVRLDDLRELVSGRLHELPRLRQKVMFVPFGTGLPIWVDDDSFDIERHVRLTAVPRPGDDVQLRELFSRMPGPATRPGPAAVGDVVRRRRRGRSAGSGPQVPPTRWVTASPTSTSSSRSAISCPDRPRSQPAPSTTHGRRPPLAACSWTASWSERRARWRS